MVCDPMSARRGGKVLPMEDISFCQCPLPGVEQVLSYPTLCNLFHDHSKLLISCSCFSLAFLVFVMGMVELELPKLQASMLSHFWHSWYSAPMEYLKILISCDMPHVVIC